MGRSKSGLVTDVPIQKAVFFINAQKAFGTDSDFGDNPKTAFSALIYMEFCESTDASIPILQSPTCPQLMS
jgi:hypothetical protein